MIPQNLHEDILSDLHVWHPGIVWMKALARMHVWWPNVDEHIGALVKGRARMSVSTAKSVKYMDTRPNKLWNRIYMDFVGPFENSMFLIVVDTHPKWMEGMRMDSSTINA